MGFKRKQRWVIFIKVGMAMHEEMDMVKVSIDFCIFTDITYRKPK